MVPRGRPADRSQASRCGSRILGQAAPGSVCLALRLAAGLYQWWTIRGHLVEGAAWLEEVLARDGGQERTRAMALVGLGLIAHYRGEQERARDLLTRSVEHSQRCGYQRAEARALVHLGPVRALCGDAAGAAQACDRALAAGLRPAEQEEHVP